MIPILKFIKPCKEIGKKNTIYLSHLLPGITNKKRVIKRSRLNYSISDSYNHVSNIYNRL